jgi:hypothetical protein
MTGPAAAMGQMVWEGVQVAHRLQPRILGQPVKLIKVEQGQFVYQTTINP